MSDNTRAPGARKFPVLVLRERFCYDDDFDCMELDDIISFHDVVTAENPFGLREARRLAN